MYMCNIHIYVYICVYIYICMCVCIYIGSLLRMVWGAILAF